MHDPWSRALIDVELPRLFRDFGNKLNSTGTGAYNRDTLARQVTIMIPICRMKGGPLKRVNALKLGNRRI